MDYSPPPISIVVILKSDFLKPLYSYFCTSSGHFVLHRKPCDLVNMEEDNLGANMLLAILCNIQVRFVLNVVRCPAVLAMSLNCVAQEMIGY